MILFDQMIFLHLNVFCGYIFAANKQCFSQVVQRAEGWLDDLFTIPSGFSKIKQHYVLIFK